MENLAVVILAAGKGTRMKQERAKVLSETSEKTLIEHVLDQAEGLAPQKTIVVTGYQADTVEKKVLNTSHSLHIECCLQESQRGTGDAVKAALPALEGFKGLVLILYGDVPLVKVDTLKTLIETHEKEKATLSILTLKGFLDNAYGRILRKENGAVAEIKECKDCSSLERSVDETNSGILLVDSVFLNPALEELEPNNVQGEYYLTDIVAKAVNEGQHVATHTVYDEREIQGVNTLFDLQNVNRDLLERRLAAFVEDGVLFEDPSSVYIDAETSIAAGAQIGPNVHLRGGCVIEEGVVIEGSAYLINAKIGKGTLVKFGIRIEDSEVGGDCQLGPFAQLRPECELSDEVRVGNFVELKKSHIGKGSKVNHLSYIGDATLGEGVNIGAGTITCNYDGFKKSKTIIKDGAFTGSNSALVAPLTIESGAYVGAGSVITKDVPKDALAVARAQTKVIENWAKKKN